VSLLRRAREKASNTFIAFSFIPLEMGKFPSGQNIEKAKTPISWKTNPDIA
jgi:hypothetical protein